MVVYAALLGIQWALLPEKLHIPEENGIFNYQTFTLSIESPLEGGTEEQCEKKLY